MGGFVVNNVFHVLAAGIVALACVGCKSTSFIRTAGTGLVDGDGNEFRIRGTNLGNWLNPEGYMFGFGKCSSPHMIDEVIRQLVGPEEAKDFWKRFKDNYITEADIAFVAKTGANTVRLPFHYKLFTCEDYLGANDPEEGFRRMDAVIGWCRKYGLRVVIDMHDCPGGQTGSNIDDSYGYPWLFVNEACQRQYCDIWRRIAARYADEPVVLGYDLMNEPISSDLSDMAELNKRLAAVQRMAADAIRSVDRNHILMFAGGQWDTNFAPFEDFEFKENEMFTCHCYQFGNPVYDDGSVANYAAIRDRKGVPMYMGETGHNQPVWNEAIRKSMEEKNIGWTYWPLKKPDKESWLAFKTPEGWNETIAAFAKSDRSSYKLIQNRPERAKAQELLNQYLENCRFGNCTPDAEYLKAVGLSFP